MKHSIWKKWGIFSLVLLLTMGILAGCSSNAQETGSQPEESATENTKNQEEQTSHFPVTITDDADKEITIGEEPQTIVSLQPSNTEVAYALDLGEKMVGVSDYDNYPAEVDKVEKVGAQDMNVELILSLLPDIAFVTDYHQQNHAEVLKQFEEAGIHVIVIGSQSSFEDVYETIALMGDATGKKEEAEEIITDMKDRLKAVKEKAEAVTEKKNVWVEVSPAPDIFTTGQGTFMHEMLEAIQAHNVAGDQEGWVKLTEEEIVQLNPDVIITTYGYYVENPRDEVITREGWAEVPAIKAEQVHDVNSDTVTRPGPRLIEGVETLAKLIYPEIFEQ